MALGEDALSAGYETVSPTTDLVKDGADEITLTRDYVGQVKASVTAANNATRPVNRGGTGATDPQSALRNLGVYVQSNDPGHANGRVWIKIPG